MKLNKNSKLTRLYMWSYNTPYWRLPNDLCTYFWKLLFAIVVFPLTWLSYPFKCNHIFSRIGVSLLCLLGLILIGLPIGLQKWGVFIILGIVIGMLVGITATIGLIAFVCGLLTETYYKVRSTSTVEELMSIVRERKTGFKEKYCPRIEWAKE